MRLTAGTRSYDLTARALVVGGRGDPVFASAADGAALERALAGGRTAAPTGAPLEAVSETFTWRLPADLPAGPVTVKATVYYSRLVPSVGRFLKVPEEEWAAVLINEHQTRFTVLP